MQAGQNETTEKDIQTQQTDSPGMEIELTESSHQTKLFLNFPRENAEKENSIKLEACCNETSSVRVEDVFIDPKLRNQVFSFVARPQPPKYYLRKIKKAVYAEKEPGLDADRFLAHFNSLRKCFDAIVKFKPVSFNNTESVPKYHKKVLVLDLDETLVHSYEQNPPNGTHTVDLLLYGKHKKTIYVKLRPFVREFLTLASEMFELCIFTASHSTYANPIVDLLDPMGKIFKARYYSNSCTQVDKYLVKDLRIIGCDLKDIIIVDNTVLCFGLQLANGIPIVCYRGQQVDTELYELIHLLAFLSGSDDVRQDIMSYFRWDLFGKLYKDSKALVKYYIKNIN